MMDLQSLSLLFSALQRRGYTVVGPTVRDGAVLYDALESSGELPVGWADEQEPGRFRLARSDSAARFGYVNGINSWKQFLHPPEVRLVQIERNGGEMRIQAGGEAEPAPKYAFLGVRACELAAMDIQDRVLLKDRYADPVYRRRREGVFLIAVQCTRASANCFCSSMGTGPEVKGGYDLCLTEFADGHEVRYAAAAGTPSGAEVLEELPSREATEDDVRRVKEAAAKAQASMTRRLDTSGIREMLYASFDHPRWEDAARRCLCCANCTMACPTCFCSTVEDTSDVSGRYAERCRKWDSCFVQSFSYIHGGSVRMSGKSRYRQWLTHKLAAWIDQFGVSGCVGCGRCITSCPVGIDITVEAAALRGNGAPASVAGD